jgi:hypothetical protein
VSAFGTRLGCSRRSLRPNCRVRHDRPAPHGRLVVVIGRVTVYSWFPRVGRLFMVGWVPAVNHGWSGPSGQPASCGWSSLPGWPGPRRVAVFPADHGLPRLPRTYRTIHRPRTSRAGHGRAVPRARSPFDLSAQPPNISLGTCRLSSPRMAFRTCWRGSRGRCCVSSSSHRVGRVFRQIPGALNRMFHIGRDCRIECSCDAKSWDVLRRANGNEHGITFRAHVVTFRIRIRDVGVFSGPWAGLLVDERQGKCDPGRVSFLWPRKRRIPDRVDISGYIGLV